MCVSCVSTTETVLGQMALATAVLRQPVRSILVTAGVAAPIDPVRRDRRTVDFLRSLELDPVEILGSEVVAAADAWVPAPYARRRWARPIGSHSLLAAQ